MPTIVNLQGGLGNQMFQAAYGISKDKNVKFNLSLLKQGNPPRRYELGQYMDLQFTEEDGEKGYWQSEKYFDRKLIRNRFAIPRTLCPDIIATESLRVLNETTCFVGVRRGDYLWPERINYHGVLPIEYYHEAMNRIEKRGNVRFLFFSDDTKWCVEQFGKTTICTGTAWDIWLMSLCSHAIIANSSFHWWGAWLGREKRVIAPKNWFVTEVQGTEDIVPERWERI